MIPEVRVSNLLPGSKGTICHADVTLLLPREGRSPVELLTIRDCCLLQRVRGPMVGVPGHQWRGWGDSKHRTRLVQLPKHTYKAVLVALQEAWAGYEAAPQGSPDGE